MDTQTMLDNRYIPKYYFVSAGQTISDAQEIPTRIFRCTFIISFIGMGREIAEKLCEDAYTMPGHEYLGHKEIVAIVWEDGSEERWTVKPRYKIVFEATQLKIEEKMP